MKGTIRIDDRGLRVVLDGGDELVTALSEELRSRLQTRWAPKIAADANVMVPVELSTLQDSQQVESTPGGFRITYGGLASEYVEKQHEDDSLQHTPPTTRFTYEGPFGGDNPGAWNPIGGLRGVEHKLFGEAIEWDADEGGAQWRFIDVEYSRRSPRTDHPIKATATHHWLYGASHSACESNFDAMIEDLTDYGRGILERMFAGA